MFDSSFFVVSSNNATNAKPHGCNNGALMDRFGVLIQGLLAIVAFSTLMLKRFREPKGERRPWRIWFYDTSKQAIGALFIHFANVFLSNLTEEDPCSLYLMNFLLDATLGMLLIWAGVKAISCVVEYKQFTLLTFGEYVCTVVGGMLSLCYIALIGHGRHCEHDMTIRFKQIKVIWSKTCKDTTFDNALNTKASQFDPPLLGLVLLAAGDDTDPSESEHEGDFIQDSCKIQIMDSSYSQQV
ncbi:UNVERIFIED_CONTAM: hypothetical protein FKN15_035173 [Acipenser sinensis]